MLNKKDPLIDAIQQVMQSNQADRDAIKAVNEKFGIQDRRVLPHERQGEWDAAYKSVLTEGVEALDEKIKMSKKQFANLDGKPGFTGNDLAHARAGTHKKKAAAGELEEAEKKMKGDDPCWKNYKMVGMKKKGGKPVPNCVPVSEEGDPSKAIPGDTVTGSGTVTTVPKPKATEITSDQKAALTKKIQSIKEAKKASMCESNNEGFNDRHDSSVTASVEGQVVADQLNEKVGVPLAARQKNQQVATDNAATQARVAREPAQAPSSIGTKVSNAIGAVDAGVRKFAQGIGGDYVAAAGDYAVKNVGAKLGIGQGTTYAKELEQEKEKSKRAELNNPTATKIGKAADDIATVAGFAGLAKSGVKYGAKKLIQKSADDTVAATTKTLPSSTKAVSQAAREPASTAAAKAPTAVDNFISKAKSTPVTPAAREPASTAAAKAPTAVDNFISKAKSTPVSPAAKEGGSAASKAAANVSKYNKPGTAGGRFSDNLAKARKGSENYGPSKGGVAVRKTTEPATVTRPGVPAVTKKPGVPAVANKPGVPAVANRPGLPATVGSAATKVASQTGKSKLLGRLGKAAVATAVGGAMYGLSNKNSPDSAGATPATGSSGSSGGSAKPSADKPVTAKPTSAKPVAASPAASAVKSRLQTRNQRDDTIGADGRSTKGPGGVTSGTKTGKTITNRPVVGKKAPVGTGRVK